MAGSSIRGQIQNFEKLLSNVEAIKGAGEKAISNTLKDVKARAPGWIASEVVKTYNIKKGEITPSSGKNAKPKKMAGAVNIKGETFEDFSITYTGSPLTPLHFGMTPKKPTALLDKRKAIPAAGLNLKGGAAAEVAMARVRKPYNVKLTVKKGQKKQLNGKYDTPIYLAPASKTSSTMIPYQRTPGGKFKAAAIHTLSVPQMITNEEVNATIYKKLNEETAKRLQHNFDRALGR